MYKKNIELLEKKVMNHAFIRNIKDHIKPDGSFDIEGNLKIWDEACADFEKIYLWPDSDESALGADCAYMIFIPSEKETADTILVAHGGGFNIRTGCEGPNVAWEFHKRGYNTAILAYRMQPHTRHESLADMQRAIRLLRAKTKELEIGKNIIAMGFSAGAMLAGNCATYFDNGDMTSEDEVMHFSSRPDLAVISYGAMSCVSFPIPFMAQVDLSLFGEDVGDRYFFATEKHVTPESSPMFIWQTLSDDGRHGMTLAKACQDAAVPYELHIMDGGVHGLGLADGENDLGSNVKHINHWVTLSDEWIGMMLNGK